MTRPELFTYLVITVGVLVIASGVLRGDAATLAVGAGLLGGPAAARQGKKEKT